MEHVTPCQNVPKRREKQVELVLLGKNYKFKNENQFEIPSKPYSLDLVYAVCLYSIQQVLPLLKTVPTSKIQTFHNHTDPQAPFHGR